MDGGLTHASPSMSIPLVYAALPAARHGLRARQESRPIAPDIDERRPERRHHPANPAEVDAAGLAAVAALDKQLDGKAVFEQRRTPLARAGGDQQFAVQLGA